MPALQAGQGEVQQGVRELSFLQAGKLTGEKSFQNTIANRPAIDETVIRAELHFAGSSLTAESLSA